MEVPDGIPKWAGHKGESELLQEMTADEGYVLGPPFVRSESAHSGIFSTMPKYKGKAVPKDEKFDDAAGKRAGL